jgi:hypothetical protein
VLPQNTSCEIDHLTKTFKGPSRIDANGEVTAWAQYPLEPARPIEGNVLTAMQRSEVMVPDFEQYLKMHPEYRGWNPEKSHPGWKPEYRMMELPYWPSTPTSQATRHRTSDSGRKSKNLSPNGQVSNVAAPATLSKARKGKARAVNEKDDEMTPSGSTKGNKPSKDDIPQVRGQSGTSAVTHRNMKRPTSQRAKELQTSGANHDAPNPLRNDMQYESNNDILIDAFGTSSVSAPSLPPSQEHPASSNTTAVDTGSSMTDWMRNLWTCPRTGRINGHWFQLPVFALASLRYLPNPSTEFVADSAFLPSLISGTWVQFQSSQIIELDGFHWILPAACPIRFVSLAGMESTVPWFPTL